MLSPTANVIFVVVIFFLYALLTFIFGVIPIIIIRKIIKDKLEGKKWFNFIYIAMIIAIVLTLLLFIFLGEALFNPFKTAIPRPWLIFISSIIINIPVYFIYKKIVL
jgi:hypothetical protein